MEQIKKKGYKQYEENGKSLILIGVQFTPKDEEGYFDWVVEEIGSNA